MAPYDNDQAEIDAMSAPVGPGLNAINNIDADNTSSDLNNNIGGLRSAVNTLSHNVAQFAKNSVSMAKEVAASATKDLNVDKQGFLMRNAAVMSGPFGAIISKAITDSGVGDRIGGYVKDGAMKGIHSIGSTVKSMFGRKGGDDYDSQSGYMSPSLMTKSFSMGNTAVVKELHQGVGAQLIQANKYAQDELDQTKYGNQQIVTAIKDLDSNLQGKQNGRTGAKPQNVSAAAMSAAPVINNYYNSSSEGSSNVPAPKISVNNDSVVEAINSLNQNFVDNANKTGKMGFIGEILGGTRLGTLFKGKYTSDIAKSTNPLETLVSASLQIYRWQRLYGELQKKQLNELIKLSGGEEKDVVGEHGLLKEAWFKQNDKMKKALGPLGGFIGDMLFFDQNKFDDMNRAQAGGALQQVLDNPSKNKGFKGVKDNFKDWWGKSGDKQLGTQGYDYEQILELQQRLAAKHNTFEKLKEFHEDTNELGQLKEDKENRDKLRAKLAKGKGGWFGTSFRAKARQDALTELESKDYSKIGRLKAAYNKKYSQPESIFDKFNSGSLTKLSGVVKGSLPVTIVGTTIDIPITNSKSTKLFAEGGVVDKPTNAVIGEAGPEAVVPLKKGKFKKFISDLTNKKKLGKRGKAAAMIGGSVASHFIPGAWALPAGMAAYDDFKNQEYLSGSLNAISAIASLAEFIPGVGMVIPIVKGIGMLSKAAYSTKSGIGAYKSFKKGDYLGGALNSIVAATSAISPLSSGTTKQIADIGKFGAKTVRNARSTKKSAESTISKIKDGNYVDALFEGADAADSMAYTLGYADGGIVNKKITARSRKGKKLKIGESGPEAIVPLKRKKGNLLDAIAKKVEKKLASQSEDDRPIKSSSPKVEPFVDNLVSKIVPKKDKKGKESNKKKTVFDKIADDVAKLRKNSDKNIKNVASIAKAELDENKTHDQEEEAKKKAGIWEKAKGPAKEKGGIGKTLKGIGGFLLKNPWLIGIAGMLLIPGVGKWMMSSISNFAKGFTMIKKVGPIVKMIPKFIGGFSKVLPAMGKALTGVSKFGHMGKLMKIGLGLGGKAATKAVFKIPVLGSIMQILFAINRFRKGDIRGGLLEVASGIAACFPGIGTGISLVIDALNMMMDINKDKSINDIDKDRKTLNPFKRAFQLRNIPVIGSFIRAQDAMKFWKAGKKLRSIGEWAGAAGMIMGVTPAIEYVWDLAKHFMGGDKKEDTKQDKKGDTISKKAEKAAAAPVKKKSPVQSTAESGKVTINGIEHKVSKDSSGKVTRTSGGIQAFNIARKESAKIAKKHASEGISDWYAAKEEIEKNLNSYGINNFGIKDKALKIAEMEYYRIIKHGQSTDESNAELVKKAKEERGKAFEKRFAKGGIIKKYASGGHFATKTTNSIDDAGNPIQYGEAGTEAIMPLKAKPGNLLSNVALETKRILSGKGPSGPVSMGQGAGGGSVHAGDSASKPMTRMMANELAKQIIGPGKFFANGGFIKKFGIGGFFGKLLGGGDSDLEPQKLYDNLGYKSLKYNVKAPAMAHSDAKYFDDILDILNNEPSGDIGKSAEYIKLKKNFENKLITLCNTPGIANSFKKSIISTLYKKFAQQVYDGKILSPEIQGAIDNARNASSGRFSDIDAVTLSANDLIQSDSYLDMISNLQNGTKRKWTPKTVDALRKQFNEKYPTTESIVSQYSDLFSKLDLNASDFRSSSYQKGPSVYTHLINKIEKGDINEAFDPNRKYQFAKGGFTKKFAEGGFTTTPKVLVRANANHNGIPTGYDVLSNDTTRFVNGSIVENNILRSLINSYNKEYQRIKKSSKSGVFFPSMDERQYLDDYRNGMSAGAAKQLGLKGAEALSIYNILDNTVSHGNNLEWFKSHIDEYNGRKTKKKNQPVAQKAVESKKDQKKPEVKQGFWGKLFSGLGNSPTSTYGAAPTMKSEPVSNKAEQAKKESGEKKTGFWGNLFGGSKKSSEPPAPKVSNITDKIKEATKGRTKYNHNVSVWNGTIDGKQVKNHKAFGDLYNKINNGEFAVIEKRSEAIKSIDSYINKYFGNEDLDTAIGIRDWAINSWTLKDAEDRAFGNKRRKSSKVKSATKDDKPGFFGRLFGKKKKSTPEAIDKKAEFEARFTGSYQPQRVTAKKSETPSFTQPKYRNSSDQRINDNNQNKTLSYSVTGYVGGTEVTKRYSFSTKGKFYDPIVSQQYINVGGAQIVVRKHQSGKISRRSNAVRLEGNDPDLWTSYDGKSNHTDGVTQPVTSKAINAKQASDTKKAEKSKKPRWYKEDGKAQFKKGATDLIKAGTGYYLVSNTLGGVGKGIGDTVKYTAKGIGSAAGGVLGGLGQATWGGIKGAGQAIGGIGLGLGQVGWGALKGVGQAGWGVLKGAGQATGGALKGAWKGAKGIGGGLWEILKGNGEAGVDKILIGIKDAAVETVKGIGKGAWSIVKGMGKGLWSVAKGLAKGTWSAIKGVGKGLWSLGKGIAKGTWTAVKGIGKGAWNLGKAAVALPWNIAKGVGIGAWKTAKGLVTAPWNMAAGAVKWMFGSNKPKPVAGGKGGVGGVAGAAKGAVAEEEPRGTYADIFKTCIKYGKNKKPWQDLRKYLCNAFAKHPTLKKDRTARDYVAKKAIQFYRAKGGNIPVTESNKLYSDLYWGRFGNVDDDKKKGPVKGSAGTAAKGAVGGAANNSGNGEKKKNGYKIPWVKLAAHTGLIDHNAKNLYKWASPHVTKAAKWIANSKVGRIAKVYKNGIKNVGFGKATKALVKGLSRRALKTPLAQKVLASAPVKAISSAVGKVSRYAKVYKNGVKNLGFAKATKAAVKGLGKRAFKSIASTKLGGAIVSDASKVGKKMLGTFKKKGVIASLKSGYRTIARGKTVGLAKSAIQGIKNTKLFNAVKSGISAVKNKGIMTAAKAGIGKVTKAVKGTGAYKAVSSVAKNISKTAGKAWKVFKKNGIYQGGKVITDAIKKGKPYKFAKSVFKEGSKIGKAAYKAFKKSGSITKAAKTAWQTATKTKKIGGLISKGGKAITSAKTAATTAFNTVKNNKYVQKAINSKAGQAVIKGGKSVAKTAVKYGKDIAKVARISARAFKNGGVKAGFAALKNAGKHSATFRRAVGGVKAIKGAAAKVFGSPQLKALGRAMREAKGAGKAAYKVLKSGKGINAAAQMGIKSLKGSKVIGGTIKGAKAMFTTGVNAIKNNKYVQKAVNSKVGQAVIKGGKKVISGAKGLANLVKSKGLIGAGKAGIAAIKNSKMLAEAAKVGRIAKRAAAGKGLIKGTVAATKAAINAAKHTKTIRTVASGLSKAKNVIGNTKVVKGAVRAFKDARGVGKAVFGAIKSGKGIKNALKVGKAAFKGTKTLKTLKNGVSAAKTGFTLAKTVMKGGIKSLMSGGLKAGMKAGVKGLAKGGLKGIAKKIPILGTVLSLFFAFQRFRKGEWGRGIIELLSGVASLIPGVGTGISIVLDLLNMFLDKKMADQATGAGSVKEKPKTEKKEKKGPKWLKRFSGLFNKAKDHWSKGNYIRAIGYGIAALACGNPITGGINSWFLKKLGIDVDGEKEEDKPKGDKKPKGAADSAKAAKKDNSKMIAKLKKRKEELEEKQLSGGYLSDAEKDELADITKKLGSMKKSTPKPPSQPASSNSGITQVQSNNLPTVKANMKQADETRAANDVNKQKKAQTEISKKLDENTGKMISSNTNNVVKMSRNMSQVINNNGGGGNNVSEPFRVFTKSNNEISMI